MPISQLAANELRLSIDPQSLRFQDTSELINQPLPWIGQERAERAAHFGLTMQQADYNLFVLGEVGSGRSSLLKQAMLKAAEQRPVPPDLCYLHNFEAPERPRALHLPAGKGRILRQTMAKMVKTLTAEIPQQLDGPDYKLESERIEKTFKDQETQAFADLDAFAEERHFTMRQESGQMMFTLRGPKGHAMTEDEMLALSKEEREAINQAEEALLAEINRYFEITRPLERQMEDDLTELRRQVVRPLLEREVTTLLHGLTEDGRDCPKLSLYLEQLSQDILDNLELFKGSDPDEDALRVETLNLILARYRINLVVDNSGLAGAPVIIEDNPLYRSLFGSIEYHTENEALVTDFSRIRAGSLLKAHGGFLLLHLRDLLADPLVWEKLRRFLRSGHLQIEEPGTAFAPIAAVSLTPDPVTIEVKIVLIGSRDLYYELQEGDPEFARRFRVKVDFVEEFLTNESSRHASAVFVAQTCAKRNLPHFTAAAVARLLENAHRETDDQRRQSAIFGHTDARIVESASMCRQRGGELVTTEDIDQANLARSLRHNYPEQRMRESIADGEVLIDLEGERIGQVNGLSVIDLSDHRFGFPVRVTARTHAGEDGLTNIEREVELSGPIHDKGVFILENYLAALFSRNAPLTFNASIVFEQEYNGIEGDSASCAELFALISALAGVPVSQGIAVTGALNQHGEVLPVGGINEKIEGFFRVCKDYGLTGNQGVIIPERNRRNLMLDHEILEAVQQGQFHLYTAGQATDGLELLTGLQAGQANSRGLYPKTSLLGHVQRTLGQYHRACNAHERHKDG
ncbi:MAG: ATP-binding protein [Desulfobulbus sp.]|nr:ATP-binding protein [Desulfobulbus sp.]